VSKPWTMEKVLAHDVVGRRLIIMDSSLAVIETVMGDSGTATRPYPQRAGALTAYRGDSTILWDFDAQALLIIAPSGRIHRIMAAPRNAFQRYGPAFIDARGQIVYRPPPRPGARPADRLAQDSAPIIATVFERARPDTVAWLKVPYLPRMEADTAANGNVELRFFVNPSPVQTDDWTVTSDGVVAIVRGQDYTVEWFEGARKLRTNLPYDWRRLTDSDKRVLLDSARRFVDSLTSIGRRPHWQIRSVLGSKPETTFARLDYATLDQIPSYVPPVRYGTALADRANRMWIIPTMSLLAGDGLVYDVVHPVNGLMERANATRAIAFGPLKQSATKPRRSSAIVTHIRFTCSNSPSTCAEHSRRFSRFHFFSPPVQMLRAEGPRQRVLHRCRASGPTVSCAPSCETE
jgi:hypothetical protein